MPKSREECLNNMIVITFNLLPYMLEGINEIVNMGKYPNRAEAIRTYIRDGMRNDLDFVATYCENSHLFEFYKRFLWVLLFYLC